MLAFSCCQARAVMRGRPWETGRASHGVGSDVCVWMLRDVTCPIGFALLLRARCLEEAARLKRLHTLKRLHRLPSFSRDILVLALVVALLQLLFETLVAALLRPLLFGTHLRLHRFRHCWCASGPFSFSATDTGLPGPFEQSH